MSIKETEEINLKNRLKSIVLRAIRARTFIVIILIIITSIIIKTYDNNFLNMKSIESLGLSVAIEVPVVIGIATLLISGGFDLSVGSVSALAMVVTGYCIIKNLSIPLAMILGLMSGLGIGFINGIIISKLKINALIVTLGTMAIARGIPLILTEGRVIVGFPKTFSFLGSGKILGLTFPIILAFIILIISEIFLRRIRVFRQIYYVGGNENSAIYAGINVNRIKLSVYMVSGLFAALNGLMMASRLMSSTPSIGQNLSLNVIAAAIIGGCTLTGGEGSLIGAVLGLIFMHLIKSGMVFMRVSVYWQGIVIGCILIFAVALDALTKSKRNN